MTHMSKLEIPGFYKFLRRKTRSKIWNKDRMGYRGSRKRYSVWRAEYNQKWEQHDKDIVERICNSHGLNIKDYFIESEDDRNPWESALLKLKSEGYIPVSVKTNKESS